MSRFDKPLTGKRRYRKGLFGKLILQVEQTMYFTTSDGDHPREGTQYTEWRDAQIEDLTTGVHD